MKGPRHVDELDLKHRDLVFNQIQEVIKKLEDISVYPALLWVWAFAIIEQEYEAKKELQEYADEIIAEGVTLKQIFDKFWEDVDDLGLSMEYGVEILEDTVLDWMRENDFIIYVDEDEVLDD